eukprot:573829-Amphidinium_carterae.1
MSACHETKRGCVLQHDIVQSDEFIKRYLAGPMEPLKAAASSSDDHGCHACCDRSLLHQMMD